MRQKVGSYLVVISLLIGVLPLTLLGNSSTIATKMSLKVTMDNVDKTLETYNINNNNYVKLRDVAELLSKTPKNFSVTWDNVEKAIHIQTGKTYINASHQELQQPQKIEVVQSSLKVYINDKENVFTTYNIQGHYYFKLRDLGEALNFEVVWDSETQQVKIYSLDYGSKEPISTWSYVEKLGKGLDVDWSKTEQGRQCYNRQVVKDFKKSGVSHVRIRVKDKISEELLKHLDRQIKDCLEEGIVPIIAYQADEFKNSPTESNIQKVVSWWEIVAERYKNYSHLLSFDLIIEATDALNKDPEKLNEIYERLVTKIRKTNPTRIIMISPRLRSDADYLKELKIPTKHNGYVMAEWHFYASGPSKTNERKLWTTGTLAEKKLITNKINKALEWQKQTGIPTWVGAWMPGNYNDGNDYSVPEQVVFAKYMTSELVKAGIPFAVNSDTKFYDRENNQWIKNMEPVFKTIFYDVLD